MGIINNSVYREYIYTAVFLSKEDVLAAAGQFHGSRLANVTENPHVTFSFRPEEVNTDLFGRPVDVAVTGYGNDGENEGLRVELQSDDMEIEKLIEKIPVPHITVSLAEGAKAMDTGHIQFDTHAEKKILLHGVYGAFAKDGKVKVLD